MKKILSILTISAVVLTSFYGCQHEQEDLFDQTSALRLEEAMKEYTALLTSAENGWAMEYFANSNYKGYMMFAQFYNDGSVRAAAWDELTGNKYTEEKESCMFQMIADNGPVLTFNTYSNILHRFADPDDMSDKGGGFTGTGFAGDYEFIMVSPTDQPSEIMMKGKKSGSYIRMRPIPADKEWEEYFQTIKDFEAKLRNEKTPFFWLSTANNEKYYLWDLGTGMMNSCPENGDPITEKKVTSFIINATGIRTCVPFKGNNDGFAVQSFELKDGILQCIDEGQETSKIYAPSGFEMFTNMDTWKNKSEWLFLTHDQMGGKVQEIFKTIEEKIQSNNSLKGLKISLKFHQNKPAICMTLKSQPRGSKNITINEEGETVSLILGEEDKYWPTMKKHIPEIEDLANVLAEGSYKFATDDPLKPTTIKMISTADETNFTTITIE